MRRLVVPVLFGLVGVAILAGLGLWQVQRLAWKEAVLARIEARVGAAPVALPAAPVPGRDTYLPVRAEGLAGAGGRVLVSMKPVGAGYRMISVFETGGRKVLLDRGFLGVDEPSDAGQRQRVDVTGNLHWPDEVDSFTPAPDLDEGLWFARDVPAMAAALGTEPVLIVAREITPPVFSARPVPVGTEGIANNHLQYAITWFSLALVWAGMTGLWVWHITRATDG